MLKEALSQMADVFPPNVLMRGQEYHQKGYVLNIRLSDGLLKARVKGRSNQIYNVHLDLKSWPHKPARCSCPYAVNCKHAAACLFTLQEKERYEIPAPTSKAADLSLNAWLASLREQEHEQQKPTGAHHEIVYLLTPQWGEHGHRVAINLAVAKRLKNGSLGKKSLFNSITESRKQYFTQEDEEIIASLLFKNTSYGGWFDRLFLRNSELLEKILATGRCLLAEDPESSVVLGETLPAQLEWQLSLDGTQILALTANEQVLLPLLLDKPWYFDEDENKLGQLQVPYSSGQLKNLLNVPHIELEQIPLLTQQLAEAYPELPEPKTYKQRISYQDKPVPVIIFNASDLVDYLNTKKGEVFFVELFFDYDGIVIASDDPRTTLFRSKENTLLEIQRDFAYEDEKCRELKQLTVFRSPKIAEKLQSDYKLENQLVLAHYKTEEDLPRLYHQLIPLLKSKGWRIEFGHPIYEELVEADDLEWFSELEDKGNDFFAYQLDILVEGRQVNIVPLVAELISRLGKDNLDNLSENERIKLPLPDGKVLHVTLGRIKPLLRFLIQYGLRHLKTEQPLQISRYQLILMQEAEQAMSSIAARWQGNELLRQQLQQLTATELPVVAVPHGLQATLRDYQHQGLNWLQFLRQSRFGGVLADDMGLGKTVQTLAHLQVEQEQGRLITASLIVAPTSLVGNWFEEAKRFTPSLRVLIFHGTERHHDNFDDYDIIISTYGLIQRDKTRFIDYPFYYLILDEAQSIKNARTKTTQIIQQIQASHRLCLSGTPLENHLGELWSLFHFLMPGLLGDAKQFRQFFRTPIEKLNDSERRMLLTKCVQPFMLRRSKNQVVKELPDKTETTITIELTGNQRDLYEAIRMSMEKKVRDAIAKQGLGKSHIVLLDALLKLRQVCCDPKLLSIPEAEIAHGISAKLDILMELLENVVSEGRRVLVFSQFTSMLQLIEEQLINRQFAYLKLTGQSQNRQALVNTFQEGNTPIFLISLKAGGTGLNLTRADTVIHYDPWWNPAVEDQATDRSHRIGQENPVFVYKLITAGTVEETILAMQKKKRQLFDGILSDKAGSMVGLTNNDIEQFFMPLQ